MKKISSEIIWEVIGDVFARTFVDDERRPIEGMWQVMADTAADALGYVDFYQKARNIFEIEPYVYWGTFGTIAREVKVASDVEGVIIGLSPGSVFVYSETPPPPSGYLQYFGSSVEYEGVEIIELNSGGYVAILTGSGVPTVPDWNEEDTPSYVFSSLTTLDGTERWDDIGTGTVTATDDGLHFVPPFTNWALIKDQYAWSGNTTWRQVWRFVVEKWEPTSAQRAVSIASFGTSGADYELRLDDVGEIVTVGSGLYAQTRNETLNFSGFDISRTYGSFLEEGYQIGFEINVSNTASNNGTYTVTNVTATTLTVDTGLTPESSASVTIQHVLEAVSGDSSTWESKLELATAEDPVILEFVIEYDAPNSRLFGELWLDGENVAQTEPFDVVPGPRTHTVSVLNQTEELEIYLQFVIATDGGSLEEQSQDLDFETAVGDGFAYVYQTDEPLTQSGRIQWEPWDLTPKTEIVDQTGSEISVEVATDWADYIPKYVRIESADGWVMGTLENISNGVATFSIDQKDSASTVLSGAVSLHPFYLNENEFEWEDISIFRTQYPLPFDNGEQTWFIDTRAAEYDLYNRYATMLGLPFAEDSQGYLDALRGMQYATMVSDTPEAKARAIGAIVGQPYALESGVLRKVQRISGPNGQLLYDEVTVGSRVYRIDPYWVNEKELKPLGTVIGFMEPLVKEVRLYDWRNGLEEVLKAVESPWDQWGTFLVRIPANAGVNVVTSDYIIRMLDKTKSKHNVYIIEYESLISENLSDANPNLINGAIEAPMAQPHTIEDLLFDDDGTVYQNAMNFQTVNGTPYSEEYQFPNTSTLDDGHALDEFVNLDYDPLVINDVRYDESQFLDGRDPTYFYRDAGVYLKRALTTAETNANLSRVSMRMNKPNDNQQYFTKPYELCWLFTGASPAFSARDGGGTLLTYTVLGWEDVSPTETEDLHAAYIQDSNFAYVAGDNGALWETTDYGQNWTDKTITTTDDFRGAHSNWVVGTNSVAYERVAGTWTSRTVDAGSFIFEDIYWVDSQTGFIAGHDGGLPSTSYVWRTIDGGSNWTQLSVPGPLFGGSGHQAKKIHFDPTGTYGWLALDDGLARSTDGGATWSGGLLQAGASCTSVFVVDASTVYASFDSTEIYTITNADAASEGDIVFTSSVVATTINDMHMHEDGLRGSMVGVSGETVLTGDSWVNVSTDTQGANTYYGVHHADKFNRLVAGSAGKVLRWK